MMAKENPDVNGDGHAYVKLMSAPSPTKYDPPSLSKPQTAASSPESIAKTTER